MEKIKNWLVRLFVGVIAFLCVIGLVACSDETEQAVSGSSDTYYLYEEGEHWDNIYITLYDDGTFKIVETIPEFDYSAETTGQYEIKGKLIIFTESDGEKSMGTIASGVIAIDDTYYCKKGTKPTKHTHVYDQEVASEEYFHVEATCTQGTTYFKSCICGLPGTDTFTHGEPIAHTFDQEVVDEKHLQTVATCTTDGVYYKSCICGTNGTETFITLALGHTDDFCTRCNEDITSKGLTFELSNDETYYTLTGIGECKDADLWIPSKYNDLPVTTIAANAFKNCEDLTSVTIGNSVTTISNYAFSGCSNLTKVTLPAGVETIASNAFSNCGKLETVNYKSDISGWLNIKGWTIFSNTKCKLYINNQLLTNLIISNDVETIDENAFKGLSQLKSVTIPAYVKTIERSAFESCENLESVTILNHVLAIEESVTTIGERAFYDCDSLTSVTIGNSVTTIGDSAFYDCDNLESVAIGNSVTTIGDEVFKNCDGLTRITIPDSVTTIGGEAFYNCDSLTSVTIGDSVTTIGGEAFYNCDSLTSVTIGDSVTTIGSSVFSYCDSLTSINVAENNTAYQSIDGNLYSKDGMTLIQYAKGKTAALFVVPNSVTTIGNGAFEGCKSLTNVTIPNSVTTIGASAFSSCYNLTSVTIPDSVTTIGKYAFEYCDGLESVTIGNSVTTIGDYAFYDCDSLTSVTIGNSVTTIGSSAFSSCHRLTEVYNKSSLDIRAGSSENGYIGYYVTHIVTEENERGTFATDANGYIVYTNGNDKVLVGYIGEETHYLTLPNSIKQIKPYALKGLYLLVEVKFADTSTWYRTDDYEDWQNKVNGTQVDASDAAYMADLLTDYYYGYYWYKL